MTGQAPEQKTMDEILASIRQIISDDEAKAAGRAASPESTPRVVPSAQPRPSEAPSPAREKVSRLFGLRQPGPRPVESTGPGETPAQQSVDAAIDRAIDEAVLNIETETPSPQDSASAPSGDPSPFRPREVPRPVEPDDDLEPLPRIVRPDAAGDPEALLSPEVEEKVGESFEALAAAAQTSGGRPLAALVEQTLRPMLKSWLDENLPPLVERLVREELERITRGRH